MDKCIKVASLYIATLRSIYLIHQRNHWVSYGDSFYSQHNLFQRLYESAQEDSDLAAEKFIGLMGDECLDYSTQTSLIAGVLNRYPFSGDTLGQSLAIEKAFLKLSEEAEDCFEEESRLTQGLIDTLGEIASSREEAVYLLQQNKKTASKKY